MDLYELMKSWAIPYQHFPHPAVFTCEESDRLCPEMPGAHTKQLLVRDKKGKRNILAIVMHDKKVDMRELGRILGAKDLSFASPERLKTYLGVEPGSVTPFGLIFDTEKKVEVIVDEDAWAIGQFRFHPLVNTATLVIDRAGFEKFLGKTGHRFTIVKIPQK
ncbi:MAG: prolyl-tRNA synthetase associated domain-containing protein [Patescibacteria group bacterium]